MEKKVFSIEDGSLKIHQDDIRLYSSMHNEDEINIIASTDINDVVNYGLFLLPSSLFRKQPTDEELAEDYAKGKSSSEVFRESHIKDFLAGRKSFGDKEFHLTRQEIEYANAMNYLILNTFKL